MHSWTARINAIFAFSTFIFLGLLAINIFSTRWLTPSPSSFDNSKNISLKVSLNRLTQATPKWSRRKAGAVTELSDYAFVSLEMEVDLRSAFHWNTKQIFTYIVAEYVTPKNRVNQVVLWDRIIQSESEAVFKSTTGSEYQFVDQGTGLRNANVTFSFVYDVTPIAGFLYQVRPHQVSLHFPTEYTS